MPNPVLIAEDNPHGLDFFSEVTRAEGEARP